MTLEELKRKFLDACNDIDDNSLYVEHLGYVIELSREDSDDDWYIQVREYEGGHLYDGWWRDSEDKPIQDALGQAITGACLLDSV